MANIMSRQINFIDRENDLAWLENEYHKKGAGFIVIYGRRRVGKTTLIEEFIRDKKAIYFMADKQVEKELINRFNQAMSRSIDDPLMSDLTFNSWETLFEYWLGKEKFQTKIVVVIDEFQYLAKVNPAFPSILQRIWDERLKKKNIFLILCGSLVNMMYSTTLSYKSPLYGRRTGQMKLEPVTFHDYMKFLPKVPSEKRLEYYAITGGIPKYIETLSPVKNLLDNIHENILSKNSYLYDEPRYILNEEVTETLNYFSILKTIACGEHKIGNIASKIGIKANILTKYLDMLINLGIIERQVPVTEKNPEKSKMGLYYIKDHYFRFWFRYVFPYQSYLEIQEKDYVLSIIKEDFSNFTGAVYEKVCLENIPILIKEEKLPFTPEKWGRWWMKNEEIDIIAINDRTREILFAECKWSTKLVGLNILDELREKSKMVNWNMDNRVEYFALFSRKGFTKELEIKAKKENILLFIGC